MLVEYIWAKLDPVMEILKEQELRPRVVRVATSKAEQDTITYT